MRPKRALLAVLVASLLASGCAPASYRPDPREGVEREGGGSHLVKSGAGGGEERPASGADAEYGRGTGLFQGGPAYGVGKGPELGGTAGLDKTERSADKAPGGSSGKPSEGGSKG